MSEPGDEIEDDDEEEDFDIINRQLPITPVGGVLLTNNVTNGGIDVVAPSLSDVVNNSQAVPVATADATLEPDAGIVAYRRNALDSPQVVLLASSGAKSARLKKVGYFVFITNHIYCCRLRKHNGFN
jgi:hypothetical protein